MGQTPKNIGWQKFKALLLARAERAGVTVVCVLAEPCPRCGLDASQDIKAARNLLKQATRKGA